MGLTPDAVAAFVEASCLRHGVPVKVTDALVVAGVVSLLSGGAPDGGRQPDTAAPVVSEAPHWIDPGRVNLSGTFDARGDDSMVEDSSDDGGLAGEVEGFPFGA